MRRATKTRKRVMWAVVWRAKRSKDAEHLDKDLLFAHTRAGAWARLESAWGAQNVAYWRSLPAREGGLAFRAVKVNISWEARR